MFTVKGDNIRALAYNTDGYYPFACIQEVNLTEDTETLPNTSPATGQNRSFITRLNGWRLSLKGVLIITELVTTKWLTLDLFTDAIRKNGLDIKIEFEDDYRIKSLTGHIVISSKEINAISGQLAKFNIDALGCNAYTITDMIK